MSNELDTIKVKKANRLGYAIINKSDFDPSKHELYEKPTETAPAKPAEEKPAKAPTKKPATKPRSSSAKNN